MKPTDVAGNIYRQIEESAYSLKEDVFFDAEECRKGCAHFSVTHNDPIKGQSMKHCNVSNPLSCPFVFETIGHVTDNLTTALQEINFD